MGKWIRYLTFIVSLVSANAFAFTAANPYVALLGGYQHFQDVYRDDGDTTTGRLAFGMNVPYDCVWSWGGELGFQLGNRMRINADNVSSIIGTIPVFLTIKPMVDLLLNINYQLTPQWSLRAKLGGAYLQGLLDRSTIENENEVRPEIQLGFAWKMTQMVSWVMYYQSICGNKPTLSIVDASLGTAKIKALPSARAIFLGMEMNI